MGCEESVLSTQFEFEQADRERRKVIFELWAADMGFLDFHANLVGRHGVK
jgi:hypothetical protein